MATHHYTLFILLACAISKGVPHILVVFAPVALLQFLIAFAYVASILHDYSKPLSRHPILSQMRVKHVCILGFVYAVGYFVPTLLLIQELGS